MNLQWRRVSPLAILLICFLITMLCPFPASAWLLGGGSSELMVPDTIKTGESTDIDLIVTATGLDATAVVESFTDMIFYYKLPDQQHYATLSPVKVDLPNNFKAVQSSSLQSKAYRFTVPPFAKGTAAKMQYYVELNFDGYAQKIKGEKTVSISDDAKSSFDLKHNLSPFHVCGRDYKVSIITLQGMKVTERIAALIDQEYRASSQSDPATACYAITKLPEHAMLKSSITTIDPKKFQYRAMLEMPFAIDLVANKIYRLHEDKSFGKVLGSFLPPTPMH